jgi:hypothetical protein
VRTSTVATAPHSRPLNVTGLVGGGLTEMDTLRHYALMIPVVGAFTTGPPKPLISTALFWTRLFCPALRFVFSFMSRPPAVRTSTVATAPTRGR